MSKKRKTRIEVLPVGETTPILGRCPHCNVEIYAASASTLNPQDLPQPGAISICDQCGGISVYGDDMQLREPTPSELAGMKRSPEWHEVERASRLFRTSSLVVPPSITQRRPQ